MKNILLIGAVVLALSYFGKGQAAGRIRALLANVRFAGGVLMLDFDIQNPTGAAITIRSVVGSVTANGAAVANVSSFNAQRIAGNSSSRFTVNVKPSILGVLQYFANAVRTKLALTVGFDGDINADGLLIPIKQSAKLV